MTDFMEPLLSWSARLFRSERPKPKQVEPKETEKAALADDEMPLETMAGSRFYVRYPVRCGVDLLFHDPDGNSRSLRVIGQDLSELGLMVEASEALEPGLPVLVHTRALHIIANAQVRHCTAHGSEYLIGLEFENPLRRIFKARAENPPASRP